MPSSPTITGVINPQEPQGSTHAVSVFGTGFVTGGTVTMSGSGVTVSESTYNSSTQYSFLLVIASGATLGARDVTFTNADTGTVTATGAFTVVALPTISGISPATMKQGATGNVVITGEAFYPGAAVTFSGTGITVNSVTWNSITQVTVNVTLDGAATLSARDVTLTNATEEGDGTVTDSGALTVVTALPILTTDYTISDTGLDVGDTAVVEGGAWDSGTVTYQWFATGGTADYTGKTDNSYTFQAGDVGFFVACSITSTSDAGATSTTPDTVENGGFVGVITTPTISAPTFTGVTGGGVGDDDELSQGSTYDVVFTGTEFLPDAVFTMSGSGITVSSSTYVSDTEYDVTLVVAGDATIGGTDGTVTITNTDGGTADFGAFAVIGPAPTIDEVSPSTIGQAEQVDMTITGTGFVTGATVSFSGSGVGSYTDIVVVSDTEITLGVQADIDAPLGAGDVTVTNPDTGTVTDPGSFTVTNLTPSSPTVTSISPTFLPQGSSGTITVTGTDLHIDFTPSFSPGDGITITDWEWTDDTTVTVSVDIDPSATLGSSDIVITNGDTGAAGLGGAFTVTVTVVPPHITSIFPDNAAQGSDFDVDVVGTGFQDGCIVSFSGTGINTILVTFNSSTSLTVHLTIDGGAPTGGQDFQVFNPDDGEWDVVFTVLSGGGGGSVSAPTVTGAIPGSMAQGDTGVVEVIGTGFEDGCTVEVSGDTVVNSVTFASSTEVDVNVTIAGDATGTLTFSVTNPDTGQGSAPILSIDLPPPVTLLSSGFGPLGGDVAPGLSVSQPSPYGALNLLSARSNGGVGLVCTDPTNLIASVAMTRRRVMVTSSFTDGQTQVWSVRDKSSLTMTIACLAYDHATLQTLIAAVVGAFDQPSYLLTLTLDGIGYRWNCDNADWSVDFNQAFWHFYSAYIHLSIPRNPVPNVGPI